MSRINMLIADGHPILISGLKSLLASQSDIDIAGEATNLEQLFVLLEKHKPDILLLDISMGENNSLNHIAEIKKISEKTKILLLTVHEEYSFLKEALSKGIEGYLIKQCLYEDLIYAVRSVIKNGTYIHPVMANKLAHDISGGPASSSMTKDETLWQSLSKREQEILIGVAKGLSNKEIGLEYGLSDKTVATYRLRGLTKIKISNKTELLDLCLRLGYIKQS